VTLSLLKRAKANGYKGLVVTLDTMTLGWRPHDLDTSYLPFLHGVGAQVGTSDPVFMARYNLPTRVNEHTEFPYEPKHHDALISQGDEAAKRDALLGMGWVGEASSGEFKTWEDVKFLRDNWDGPLLLKGIQSVAVWTLYSQFLTA
jgi:lactate 2-monooxygenase